MTDIHTTRIEGRADEAAWDRYVGENPGATGYHLTAWRHVLTTVFGHRTVYLMATGAQREVRGILPLVLLSSPLFGRFLVSLPYFNYGGLLADSDEARSALLTAAADCAKEWGASHVELRHMGGPELTWPKKDHKVSMRLELPTRFDELMKAFPPKLRSQVKRGEKDGMTTHLGGAELLDDFYRVFSLNMRDLGTPVYHKLFFAEILATFSKDAKICCVRSGEKPVAAGFVYGFRQTLEIPWASSDRRYARSAPNMLLYGAALKYACEQGYRVFDFGRSSKDSGTYRFKEQWGARPVQLKWYYWLRDGGPLPELNPQNPKYAVAIRAWQHLPLPVTTWIGPMISKYLP
ncbi:MAG: FemAB family PEP-CTERM system-associated protein [Acidobacteriia bacterium]|nr:FemAB family PEP-CTERM system-associated protein [Terriglobia bacterium]